MNGEYSYNTKVYQYVDGAQVRRYKRNITKLTEEEKEKRRIGRELLMEYLDNKMQNDSNPFYSGPTVLLDELEPADAERSALCSMNRTKNVIYQIARANKWEWFVTLTFNPDKVDSTDYDAVTRSLSGWMEKLRRRLCADFAYVLVPELHKSGRYHFHGLFKNCDGMEFNDSGHRTSGGNVIYNMADYDHGFSTATRVTDSTKACGYFTKYITKDLCCLTKGRKRYWCSRNVARPVQHSFDMSDEQFRDNILEAYDDYLVSSNSADVTDGYDSYNHVSYYEFSNHKI